MAYLVYELVLLGRIKLHPANKAWCEGPKSCVIVHSNKIVKRLKYLFTVVC